MRVRITVLGLVLGCFVAVGTASAARPMHAKIDDTFTDNLCGLDVSGHAIGTDNFTPVFDSNGNVVSFKDTSSVQTTFTRNGKSLVVAASGQHAGTAVGDFSGVVTFTDNFTGLPERIYTSNGPVITHDAGVIIIETVVDFSTNPEGDQISQSVLVQHGPHPEADSDFNLFCQIFTQELG